MVMSTELSLEYLGALERGNRNLVDEGERVTAELEDRGGRGMWMTWKWRTKRRRKWVWEGDGYQRGGGC